MNFIIIFYREKSIPATSTPLRSKKSEIRLSLDWLCSCKTHHIFFCLCKPCFRHLPIYLIKKRYQFTEHLHLFPIAYLCALYIFLYPHDLLAILKIPRITKTIFQNLTNELFGLWKIIPEPLLLPHLWNPFFAIFHQHGLQQKPTQWWKSKKVSFSSNLN